MQASTKRTAGEEGYRSSAEHAYFRSASKSSADGLTYMYHEHDVVSHIRAVLSFSVARTVELSWLDDMPPADATTLHCTLISALFATTPRVLIAEVFEQQARQQGRHADAIRFAQTDLQDYHNLNGPTKVRAGQYQHSTRRLIFGAVAEATAAGGAVGAGAGSSRQKRGWE
jgi:hypothetical protein